MSRTKHCRDRGLKPARSRSEDLATPGGGADRGGGPSRSAAASVVGSGNPAYPALAIEELEQRLTPDHVVKLVLPKRTAGWGC